MWKILRVFTLCFLLFLMGCTKKDESVSTKNQENIFIIMQEKLPGEWVAENGDVLNITKDNKLLYVNSNRLIALEYSLESYNTFKITDAYGETSLEMVDFLETENGYSLKFKDKTYYK